MKWSKKAAIGRMKQNERLKAILKIEPRAQEILNEVMAIKNGGGYNRINTYYDIKERLLPLVGWRSENPLLNSMEAWDAVMKHIIDLLPPDKVDLVAENAQA